MTRFEPAFQKHVGPIQQKTKMSATRGWQVLGFPVAALWEADMPWIGRKKVAFIPVAFPFDSIPVDWPNLILRRVLFDPDPGLGGVDGSIRAWVRASSSGRADIDAVVFPMRTVPLQNVPPDIFESEIGGSLRAQGFDAAAIVMLGGPGAGTNLGYWSRFVMVEHHGIWTMEIAHSLSGFKDLYWLPGVVDPEERAIARFDEMSAARLAHPTVFTKKALGWLDDATIARHAGPRSDYELQWVGLPQPPTSGRVAAVRIGTEVPYMMVEGRKMNDPFEAGVFRSLDPGGPGIPKEGVIVYRVQTTAADGAGQNGLLPLFLLTALKPGESAALDNGVVVTNTGEVVGGFTVRIEDPGQHVIDRTALAGVPKAAGAPTSCVVPGLGVDNIMFRDSSGRLHELWRNGGGQGTTNLTGNAQAPAATGNPFAYVDQTINEVVLLFRGTDNNVRSLYWSTGAVGHDDLTGSVGAPKTAGNPVGWLTPDGVHHVVYRSGNGHLNELWWAGQDAVQHGDLTAAAGAASAVGNASCYFDPVRGTNIVAFRGTDRRIRAFYWSDGPIAQDDLSGFAGTPLAAGDPFAYFSAADDRHQVIYRGADNHLHELAWPNVAAVSGRDLSALADAVPAAGDPVAGFEPVTGTKHVFYRSADGHLHELWWFLGQAEVGRRDLTADFGAPPAADRPTFFATPQAPHLHVAYRGTDGHIYELLW